MNDKKNIKPLNKVYTTEVIERINKNLSKKHFHYEKEGGLFSFDYVIQILPETKKMMSIGDWYEYNLITITIFNLNDMFKKLFGMIKNSLNENNGVYDVTEYIERLNLIELRNHIHYVMDMIKINRFKIEQYLVYSSELEEDEPKIESINEHKMNRLAIRTIVRDILTLIKNKEKGNFYLPEDINGEQIYSFTNTNQTYTVELKLKQNDIIGGFSVDGGYYSSEETIELTIEYNPNTIQSQYYDLVGELNEVLGHELEHQSQDFKGTHDLGGKSPETPLEYYTQEHEIPAQYKGLKRLSKLTRKPFESVVRNWFKTHRRTHYLTPDEEEIVIGKILNYKY
jgi:hypothetical protein